MTKLCRYCRQEKPADAFGMRSGSLRPYCRPCVSIKNKEYHKKYPEKHGGKTTYNPDYSRRYNLRKRHGVTLEHKLDILRKQGEVCAICRLSDPGKGGWQLDHCHSTNLIRGVLCRHCNLILGLAGDDTEVLSRAIDYLNSEVSYGFVRPENNSVSQEEDETNE